MQDDGHDEYILPSDVGMWLNNGIKMTGGAGRVLAFDLVADVDPALSANDGSCDLAADQSRIWICIRLAMKNQDAGEKEKPSMLGFMMALRVLQETQTPVSLMTSLQDSLPYTSRL